MSDDDLIRRVDARRILEEEGFLERSLANLNDLPAMQVAVKPLEWFEVEKYRYGGKYTSEGYTIRYVEGFFILNFAGYGKAAWRFPTLEAAKAAAQADYAARIRSALTVTPAPDAGKVQALVEAVKELLQIRAVWADPHNDQICKKARAALAAMKDGK